MEAQRFLWIDSGWMEKRKSTFFIHTLAKRSHSRLGSPKSLAKYIPAESNKMWQYEDYKTGTVYSNCMYIVFSTSKASSLDLKDCMFIIAHKCLFNI